MYTTLQNTVKLFENENDNDTIVDDKLKKHLDIVTKVEECKKNECFIKEACLKSNIDLGQYYRAKRKIKMITA